MDFNSIKKKTCQSSKKNTRHFLDRLPLTVKFGHQNHQNLNSLKPLKQIFLFLNSNRQGQGPK